MSDLHDELQRIFRERRHLRARLDSARAAESAARSKLRKTKEFKALKDVRGTLKQAQRELAEMQTLAEQIEEEYFSGVTGLPLIDGARANASTVIASDSIPS